MKRSSQPVITPLDRRNRERKIRREISYPLGSGRKEQHNEADTVFVKSSEKVISDGFVRKKNRKTSERSDNVRKNSAEKERVQRNCGQK